MSKNTKINEQKYKKQPPEGDYSFRRHIWYVWHVLGEDQRVLTIRFLPQSLRNEVSGLPAGSIGEVWEPPSCHHRRHPSA